MVQLRNLIHMPHHHRLNLHILLLLLLPLAINSITRLPNSLSLANNHCNRPLHPLLLHLPHHLVHRFLHHLLLPLLHLHLLPLLKVGNINQIGMKEIEGRRRRGIIISIVLRGIRRLLFLLVFLQRKQMVFLEELRQKRKGG